MKALISPTEENRICQIEDDANIFEVAEPLYWFECPVDCWYDWTFSNGQFYPPQPAPEQVVDKLAIIIAERDRRLAASDWTQLADAPLSTSQKADWAAYRQALRDLPNDPLLNLDNPNWPIPPQ